MLIKDSLFVISVLLINLLSLIKILLNDGKLTDIAQASDNFNISALSKPVKKFYLFAPYLHL